MNENLSTSLHGFTERKCTVSIVLDTRTNRKDVNFYPLCIRFTMNRKSFYYPIGGSYSKKEFSEICDAQKSKSSRYEIKMDCLNNIKKYKALLESLNKGHELNLDMIKTALTHKSNEDSISFVGVWQDTIKRLRVENNGARYSTSEFYDSALKSFRRILWDHPIEGFNITVEDIRKWNDGMKNGVLDSEGNLVGKLSDSTRGIYLRHCRAIWNECLQRGYLSGVEYPFSNIKQKGLIVIPAGGNRKESYLNVEQMTRLYQVFTNKEYPESWKPSYRKKAHNSLGLFLVQYLCNGFNLADAGRLRYSQYYYDSERRAFKFNRKKTSSRSEDGSEVIVPIIEPLQKILDEIAAQPEKDALVFPHILENAKNEMEFRVRIAGENSNIQDRVIKICSDVLGWEVRPSGTWCRHSFATNLTHAGVERKYITESMGHSTSHSITDMYIAAYPLDIQFEYNSRLLNLGEKKDPLPTIDKIEKMTEQEAKALLLKLLGGKS